MKEHDESAVNWCWECDKPKIHCTCKHNNKGK